MCVCVRACAFVHLSVHERVPMGPRTLLHSFPVIVVDEAVDVLTDKGLSVGTGDILEFAELALSAALGVIAVSPGTLAFAPPNTQGEGSPAPPPTHASSPNAFLLLPAHSLSGEDDVVFGGEFPNWTGPNG